MLNTAMIAILATTLMITPAPAVNEAGISAQPSRMLPTSLKLRGTSRPASVPREHFTLPKKEVLGEKFLDLSNRYPEKSVNEVFADNIILNLHYIKGDVDEIRVVNPTSSLGPPSLRFGGAGKLGTTLGAGIDWEKAREPFSFSIELLPGETFAYHDSLLPQFREKPVKIGGSHYSMAEGYRTDGYLAGDGVCHLASLFNWTAREAGLDVLAKVNHDFASIPDIPKEFGVSIYSIPNSGYTSEAPLRYASEGQAQNLYITNTFSFPVTFSVEVESGLVGITISR